MSTFELYLLLLLPNIKVLFEVLAFIFGMLGAVSIVGTIISFSERLEERAQNIWKKAIKICASVCIVSAILTTVMPSDRQIGMLIAYELGSSVDGLTELPSDVVSYLREHLRVATEEVADSAREAITEEN